MSHTLRLAIMFLWWWSACVAAMAQPVATDAGVLSCTLESATGTRSSDGAAAPGGTHIGTCSFKDKTGSEETYSARVRVVGPAAGPTVTMLWVVKVPPREHLPAGFLQQSYAVDARTTPDADAPAIIGEMNPDIVLLPMSDKQAGDTAKTTPRTNGILITGAELTLKTTSA